MFREQRDDIPRTMKEPLYADFGVQQPEHDKIASVSTGSDALSQLKPLLIDNRGLCYKQAQLIQFLCEAKCAHWVILRNIVTDGL